MIELIDVVWVAIDSAITSAGWRSLVGTLLGAGAATLIYFGLVENPLRVWITLATLLAGIAGGLVAEPRGKRREF